MVYSFRWFVTKITPEKPVQKIKLQVKISRHVGDKWSEWQDIPTVKEEDEEKDGRNG